jgi:hypothetical protein
MPVGDVSPRLAVEDVCRSGKLFDAPVVGLFGNIQDWSWPRNKGDRKLKFTREERRRFLPPSSNPKRKRGRALPPSLTLRVTFEVARVQYNMKKLTGVLGLPIAARLPRSGRAHQQRSEVRSNVTALLRPGKAVRRHSLIRQF